MRAERIQYLCRAEQFIKGILIFICLLGFSINASAANKKTISYEIEWQENTYQGTFTGKTSKGLPTGQGVFESDDGTLRYEGRWVAGVFQGNGVITSGDGTIEEGKYYYGKRNGLIRIYDSEDSYVECLYQRDIAYGYECSYKEGELVSEKLIIQGMSREELIKEAVCLSGNPAESRAFENKIIQIEGEVVYVYEDQDSCYFRIDDAEAGYVTGKYENTTANGAQQRYMPEMTAGEHVRIYGRFEGYTRNKMESDETVYGWDCLTIDPYYGEIVGEDVPFFDISQYADLQKYPYQIYGKRVKDHFVIEQILKKGNTYYMWAVSEENRRSEKEPYVLIYDGKNGISVSQGDTAYIDGFSAGQIKTIRITDAEETSTYDMFPAIRVNSIGED